jgi:integrase
MSLRASTRPVMVFCGRHQRPASAVASSAWLAFEYLCGSGPSSAVTYLMAAGAPPEVIMELMGHSSLAMTAAYQHVMDAALDDAAERLESVLGRVASS